MTGPRSVGLSTRSARGPRWPPAPGADLGCGPVSPTARVLLASRLSPLRERSPCRSVRCAALPGSPAPSALEEKWESVGDSHKGGARCAAHLAAASRWRGSCSRPTPGSLLAQPLPPPRPRPACRRGADGLGTRSHRGSTEPVTIRLLR